MKARKTYMQQAHDRWQKLVCNHFVALKRQNRLCSANPIVNALAEDEGVSSTLIRKLLKGFKPYEDLRAAKKEGKRNYTKKLINEIPVTA